MFVMGFWNVLLQDLLVDGMLQCVGVWWCLFGYDYVLLECECLLLECVFLYLYVSGFDLLWVCILVIDFGLVEDEVCVVLCCVIVCGELFQVVLDLFYVLVCIVELVVIVVQLLQVIGMVDVVIFCDVIGLGCKCSIQILEFFNCVGYI